MGEGRDEGQQYKRCVRARREREVVCRELREKRLKRWEARVMVKEKRGKTLRWVLMQGRGSEEVVGGRDMKKYR